MTYLKNRWYVAAWDGEIAFFLYLAWLIVKAAPETPALIGSQLWNPG